MPKIIKDPAEIAKYQSVRRRSKHSVCGLPWFDIAFGPDADTGELTGTARSVLAVGDSATGVIAIGKIARGFIAVGGVAFGEIAVGVCAVSVFCSVGVGAVSLVLSAGVASIGWNALGTYFVPLRLMAWNRNLNSGQTNQRNSLTRSRRCRSDLLAKFLRRGLSREFRSSLDSFTTTVAPTSPARVAIVRRSLRGRRSVRSRA